MYQLTHFNLWNLVMTLAFSFDPASAPMDFGSVLKSLPADSPIPAFVLLGSVTVTVLFAMWASRKVGKFFGYRSGRGLDTSRMSQAGRHAIFEAAQLRRSQVAEDESWRAANPAAAAAKDAKYASNARRDLSRSQSDSGSASDDSYSYGGSGSPPAPAPAPASDSFSGGGGTFGGGGSSGSF